LFREMKKILYLLLFPFLLFIEGCDEDPDYPIEPFIESGNLIFFDGQNSDSLKLTFLYRDGDMDLGLAPEDLDSPYHAPNLFVEDGTSLMKVSTNVEEIVTSGDSHRYHVLNLTSSKNKKLVTIRTREKEPFGFLPELDCRYYSRMEFLVHNKNKSVFDEYPWMRDSLIVNNEKHYLVIDTAYFEINPYYYNIEIDFLIEQSDGSYEKFDWFENFCVTYDGRFPIIQTNKGGIIQSGPFRVKLNSKWKGEIAYAMAGLSFKKLFANKRIKLQVKIIDRALHISNTIETPAILI
jgi:hypothetical protein